MKNDSSSVIFYWSSHPFAVFPTAYGFPTLFIQVTCVHLWSSGMGPHVTKGSEFREDTPLFLVNLIRDHEKFHKDAVFNCTRQWSLRTEDAHSRNASLGNDVDCHAWRRIHGLYKDCMHCAKDEILDS